MPEDNPFIHHHPEDPWQYAYDAHNAFEAMHEAKISLGKADVSVHEQIRAANTLQAAREGFAASIGAFEAPPPEEQQAFLLPKLPDEPPLPMLHLAVTASTMIDPSAIPEVRQAIDMLRRNLGDLAATTIVVDTKLESPADQLEPYFDAETEAKLSTPIEELIEKYYPKEEQGTKQRQILKRMTNVFRSEGITNFRQILGVGSGSILDIYNFGDRARTILEDLITKTDTLNLWFKNPSMQFKARVFNSLEQFPWRLLDGVSVKFHPKYNIQDVLNRDTRDLWQLVRGASAASYLSMREAHQITQAAIRLEKEYHEARFANLRGVPAPEDAVR